MTKLMIAALLIFAALAPARAQFAPIMPVGPAPTPFTYGAPSVTCVTMGNIARCY
jgi:hypothetical protein